jgi:hypothetical protein
VPVGYDQHLPSAREENVRTGLRDKLSRPTECQNFVDAVPVTVKMLRTPAPRTSDPTDTEMNAPTESSALDSSTVCRRATGAPGNSSGPAK